MAVSRAPERCISRRERLRRRTATQEADERKAGQRKGEVLRRAEVEREFGERRRKQDQAHEALSPRGE